MRSRSVGYKLQQDNEDYEAEHDSSRDDEHSLVHSLIRGIDATAGGGSGRTTVLRPVRRRENPRQHVSGDGSDGGAEQHGQKR